MPLQHGFRWGEFLLVENQERPSGKKINTQFSEFLHGEFY